MPANNEKLKLIIEQICSSGCERVNEVIEKLQRQESIEETSKLSLQESNIVLLELKDIMSVYEHKS